MKHRAVLAGAALLLALGVDTGCKKKPPAEPAAADDAGAGTQSAPAVGPATSTGPVALDRALVTRVEVKAVDPDGAPARELYPDLLGKRVGATLGQSGYFFVDPGAVPEGASARPAHLRMLVGYDFLPEGREGKPVVLAAVEAILVWDDGGAAMAPAMNVLAERPLEPGDENNLDGLVAEHVERAVEEAARGLVAKEGLRVGPPAMVDDALAGDDPDLVVWALAMAGERGLAEATPAVIAQLGSPDERVRDGAIGALVALRDERGVAPLTRLAEFSDVDSMRRVLDAVGAIGGQEAVDYLEFVSTGHPDSDIQAQAKDALGRLQRRAKP